jgi:integrase
MSRLMDFGINADQLQGPLMADVPQMPSTPRRRSLGNLFEAYTLEVLADRAPNTRSQYQLFFAKLLRDLGHIALDQLTTDTLRTWKLSLVEAGYKSSTVRRYMARLNTVLNFGVDELEWLTVNPLKRVRKPSAGPSRVRFLSPEEKRRLLAACEKSRNPYLLDIVILALYTGGRKNELCRLEWNQLDLEQGIVRFTQTKTKKSRAVPLSGEALGRLRALAAQRVPGCSWVFPGRQGKKPRLNEQAWKGAVRQAGIEDFHFHDTRHTFASYMCMSGASLRDVAELLGHTNIQQTMCYAHLTQGHTQGLVERMASMFLTTEQGE